MKEMNILLSCDDRVVRYIPVLMNSLYKNHVHKCKVNIFLMHSKISEIQLSTLNDYAQKNNQKLFVITVDNRNFECFLKVDPKRINSFPIEAYYHFLSHLFLPETISRILYLDVDVLCVGDMSEWYESDFEENYFVATDAYGVKDFKAFNSGCFLINLEKMRQEKIDSIFYETKVQELIDNKIVNLMGDQEFLGFVFRKFNNNGFRVSADPGMNFRIRIKPNEMYGLKDMPQLKLIHYSTFIKAWNYCLDKGLLHTYVGLKIGSNPPFDFSCITERMKEIMDFFWEYAEGTPFYDEISTYAKGRTEELKFNLRLINNENKRKLLLASVAENEKMIGSIADKPVFNNNNFSYSEEDYWFELKTRYYIKDQWIVFKLKRSLKRGEKFRVSIECEYKTNDKIYLFLSDSDLNTQHFPAIASNSYEESVITNRDGYLFLCLSSNSFKNKGDFIKFFNISSIVIRDSIPSIPDK